VVSQSGTPVGVVSEKLICWVWCSEWCPMGVVFRITKKIGLYFLFTSNYHYVYRDVKLVGSPDEASAARY
jgi:hypothetical protein